MTIPKEELEKIEKIEGEIIGNPLKNKFLFIFQKFGRKGIEKVEEEMENLGYPLRYQEIEDFQWYPEKLDILLLLVIKEIFNFDSEKIREMGRFSAKISIIAKIMMRYFVSIKRVAKEVGKYWRKYRTCGRLRAKEINEKERYLILVLEDFLGHPVFCTYLEGYIFQIASYVVPKKENLEVREIECPFRGGKDHQFRVSW